LLSLCCCCLLVRGRRTRGLLSCFRCRRRRRRRRRVPVLRLFELAPRPLELLRQRLGLRPGGEELVFLGCESFGSGSCCRCCRCCRCLAVRRRRCCWPGARRRRCRHRRSRRCRCRCRGGLLLGRLGPGLRSAQLFVQVRVDLGDGGDLGLEFLEAGSLEVVVFGFFFFFWGGGAER
jgi:hypothetical protein